MLNLVFSLRSGSSTHFSGWCDQMCSLQRFDTEACHGVATCRSCIFHGVACRCASGALYELLHRLNTPACRLMKLDTGLAQQPGWQASASACCGHCWQPCSYCQHSSTACGAMGQMQLQRQQPTGMVWQCASSCSLCLCPWHCLHQAALLGRLLHHQLARRKAASIKTRTRCSMTVQPAQAAASTTAAVELCPMGSAVGLCMKKQSAAVPVAVIGSRSISRKVTGVGRLVTVVQTASRMAQQ